MTPSPGNRRRAGSHAVVLTALFTLLLPRWSYAAQGCGLNGLLAVLDPVTRGLVSALLQLNCTATASPLNFGTYNPSASSAVQVNGEVQVTCAFSLLGTAIALPPLLVCYDITLTTGSGSYANRQMIPPTTPLRYNLYTNGTTTTVWGDGTGGSVKFSDSFLLPLGTATKSYTIYGNLPVSQNVIPGSYSDTIGVTVSY